jgi:hypothetical protein
MGGRMRGLLAGLVSAGFVAGVTMGWGPPLVLVGVGLIGMWVAGMWRLGRLPR